MVEYATGRRLCWVLPLLTTVDVDAPRPLLLSRNVGIKTQCNGHHAHAAGRPTAHGGRTGVSDDVGGQ